MLATDLSNAEIVLGKLGGRLVPVLGLIACVLPLMAISALLGGIDPNAVFGSFLATIGCAVLGCSLAITLSVWGRKPQDVLMLTYLIISLWLFCRYLTGLVWSGLGFSSFAFLMNAVSDLIDYTNPFYLVWAPTLWSRNVSLLSYLAFLAGCLIISGVLAGLATVRIRSVAQTRFDRRPTRTRRPWFAARTAKPSRSLLPGPSLDGNPVFWREWYRAKPSRFMRLVWIVYWGMGLVFVVIAFSSVVSGNTNRDMIAIMNVFQVGVGLLLLAVGATTSLVEERVRGSLDILLSTPISTRSVVQGKWLGAFRSVPQLLFAPALTTFFLACQSGRWFSYLNFLGLLLAFSALVVSLGLALATWQSRLERAVALCVRRPGAACGRMAGTCLLSDASCAGERQIHPAFDHGHSALRSVVCDDGGRSGAAQHAGHAGGCLDGVFSLGGNSRRGGNGALLDRGCNLRPLPGPDARISDRMGSCRRFCEKTERLRPGGS